MRKSFEELVNSGLLSVVERVEIPPKEERRAPLPQGFAAGPVGEPKLFNVGDARMLMYRYENGGRGGAWVPHDQVQATGQDWHYAFWNPTTGEIRDADTVDGSF